MDYNTRNPLGSSDPRDLFDNSSDFDEGMNSTADTFLDRFGRPRYTWNLYEKMTQNALDQVQGTVDSAKQQVNAVASEAEASMRQTAEQLGDDLNNKRYASYSAMNADPQTREAVVGIVDGDPDSNLDGWYAWNNTTKKWVRFLDQPASSTEVKSLQDDPQRPRAMEIDGLEEKLSVVITDRDGRQTWLGATAEDGGPSAWAVLLLREALGTVLRGYPGMLVAVTDSEGRLTDHCVRDTDGQVPDFIINDRWAPRLSVPLSKIFGVPLSMPYYNPDRRGTTTQLKGSDTYERGAEVLPILPDMTRWAGWGSSTIAQLVELTDLANDFGASYYNGGHGEEASTHIAARMGSVPALITVPTGVIPGAAGVAIEVSCSNVVGRANQRSNEGYLNGVRGTLKGVSFGFTFTRAESGEDVPTVGEFAFDAIAGADHRSDVTILNLGKNDPAYGLSAAGTISRIDASYSYLAPLAKRVIVIGQFANVGTVPGSDTYKALAAMNAHCKKRYGANFYDIGAYLTGTQVWVDTGINPTQEDLDQQALGNLPPSLSIDNLAHLNPAARAAVVEQLKAKVISLDWYN